MYNESLGKVKDEKKDAVIFLSVIGFSQEQRSEDQHYKWKDIIRFIEIKWIGKNVKTRD